MAGVYTSAQYVFWELPYGIVTAVCVSINFQVFCTPQLPAADVIQGFVDFFSIDLHANLMKSQGLPRDTNV